MKGQDDVASILADLIRIAATLAADNPKVEPTSTRSPRASPVFADGYLHGSENARGESQRRSRRRVVRSKAMIRSVSIANFRCIRQLRMTLEPLTVLVGPNGSGKSTFLTALVPFGGDVLADHWRHDQHAPIAVELEFDDGSSLRPRPFRGGRAPGYAIFRLDPLRLREQNMLSQEHALSPTGHNLTNVFATLTRKTQDVVAKQLAELVPMFDDVDAQPTGSGRHTLRFHDRWADVWYAPDEVSDGTMLVLALLMLQHQRDAVELVAIEEPERGLHPWLLGEIVKILRGMSRGEIGPRRMQILLATHSAELLEFIEPEEVRFFDRKTDDGSVRVTEAPTKTPEWRSAFDEYRKSLGEAWLSGGLGGVPGA
jgi:hypothetical protein